MVTRIPAKSVSKQGRYARGVKVVLVFLVGCDEYEGLGDEYERTRSYYRRYNCDGRGSSRLSIHIFFTNTSVHLLITSLKAIA